MKIDATVIIEATEEVLIRGRVIDDVFTVIRVGDVGGPSVVLLHGTRFHRADWLRRLAVAASQAADELDAGEQVA